jgi:very-short-patch-repair endonuclease
MSEKTCYKCKKTKTLSEFYNSKRYADGKQDSCKECSSNYTKQQKEYTCPSCNTVNTLQHNAYKKAVKYNKKCRKCTITEWQKEKYGEKKLTEFTSQCHNCGKTKKHKWNNLSPTNLINIQNTMNKKLCKNCSNTLFYTLPTTKTNTKPEIKFKNILEELNIEYIQNYRYKYNHYDFYLIKFNILVEIDGNYWHGKDKEWEELNIPQKKSRKNDLKKNKICFENNQPLLRFWEDELEIKIIKDKIETCIKNTSF